MLGTITLTVGQTDGVSVSQKEEAPGTMDAIQDEVAPQVNGEKEKKESPDANEISVAEEKAVEEKPDETNEVGFKKIFRFVGFKFTLKKDKSEEKDPVKLLTVKDKEGEEDSKADATEVTKEEAAAAEKEVKSEEKAAETEASTTEADVTVVIEEPAASELTAEDTTAEAEEGAKEEGAESSPPSQEVTQSPFKKFFTGALFSNLRKKASIKKSKEEEEEKETAAEEETKEAEETAEAIGEEGEKAEMEEEAKEVQPISTPEEVKPEPTPEAEAAAPEESKEEAAIEIPAPAADSTNEPAPVVEKAEEAVEGEKAPADVTTEAELLSSQDKAKAQGSPLKKLFTGAGLKKLSTKKHKSKKEAEAKLTESGEQAAEQLQSSTDSAEGQKSDSVASSPEESGEHVIGVEASQAEPSQEAEGEVTSDGEKKKEGIMPWSSFKKLVTPKKRVKRSSDSEDEATGEKPVKSATLSSTESAVFVDKCSEEEAKEDKPTEEEPKTENAEKLESSIEEPKKKMDTSVSWEALMCMGGAKKRTRRTSDSDDEETKIEEEAAQVAEAGEEQEGQAAESTIVTSQDADTEVQEVSSPEPTTSPPEKESTWDTLKRFVMRSKSKVEEKTEERSEQVLSDSEMPKEESSFSLRKLLHGRRKKKVEKQLSTELGSGEEDSDTPAVVPLSEYDVEPKDEAAVEVPQISVEGPVVTQTKMSTEDRSPSWIPAISVTEDDDDDKQLSDIPEEAENVATPKSADSTIADDDIEDQPMLPPGAKEIGGKRLSIAEVMPVIPAPPVETSPVPQGPKLETAEMVLETAVEQVSEIPCQTSVTVDDVPLEVASTETEYEPPIEQAESKTKAILEPHLRDEAMAICTGLETKEIAKVTLEKPVVATVECAALISDALSAEVLVEEASPIEEAIASEDPLLEAQVQQVETTELEPPLGVIASEVLPELQTASEGHEREIEKITTVNALQEELEILQPSELSENSNVTKIVLVDPIAPTIEAAVSTAEAGVEIKEKEMAFEQLAATEVITPVEEMVQAISQEMTATSSETVVLVAALAADKEDVAMGQASISESVDDEPIQVQETNKVSMAVAEAVMDISIGAAESEVSAVLEQVDEKVQDEFMVENINAIEEQGIVIANAVIQSAMDKVSEAKAEPEKPTTPTGTIPTPVQAVATIEEEIATASEGPVVTDTPVTVMTEAPVEKPKSPKILHSTVEVVCSVLEEVIESIDALTEEEKKSVEGIKHAVEETVSEEIVMEEEEVVEMNTETDGKEQSEEEVVVEEVKPAEEKEVADVSEEVKPAEEKEVADVSEEVKPAEEKEVADVSKEVEVEAAPAEEVKEPTPELHVPAEVVLQVAQVVEDPSLEEESLVEFASNDLVNDLPPAKDTTAPAAVTETNVKANSVQGPVSDSPQTKVSTEEVAPSQEAPVAETEKAATGKCAEVMAQVIEVIEEAVKEIEPVSTEITATS